MNRVLELLKRIGKAFRSNLGLKIVSLIFAFILWNYIIAVENPYVLITLHDVDVRVVGETAMKQGNLTIKGDKSIYFKPVDVTVRVNRSDAGIKSTDVTVTADLSTVSHDGPQQIRLNAIPARGALASISPNTATINIERLKPKVVPVEPRTSGTLPENIWHSKPEVTISTLEITGADTDISKVDRAIVTVPLDKLTDTGILSGAYPYTLLDANGAEIPLGNMTLQRPNGIVSLQVYPTKLVSVSTTNRFSGNPPEGYELSSVTIDPAHILVAGPADVLSSLNEVYVPRIGLSNETSTFSVSVTPELPKGVQFAAGNTVTVTMNVQMTMDEVPLDNLPVSVIGLGSGLTVDGKLAASIRVTCPQLYASRVRSNRVHLSVDASGLGVGTHTLPVKADIDTTVGATASVVTPTQVMVTIKSDIATTAAMGGP